MSVLTHSTLLRDATCSSPVWARVGALLTTNPDVPIASALRLGLSQTDDVMLPELACSTYVVTCVY